MNSLNRLLYILADDWSKSFTCDE